MQSQLVLDFAEDVSSADRMYWHLTKNNDNPIVDYTFYHLMVRYNHNEWRVLWWSNRVKNINSFNNWLSQWYIDQQPQLMLWQIKFMAGHNKESSTLEYIKKVIEHEISH